MKSGQLFWGCFLLTLGALFLLVKYDVFMSDFSFIWDLWPLIFIFWGAMVIFKNDIVRPVISAAFGIFLAIMVFGFFDNIFATTEWDFHTKGFNNQSYIQEYNPEVKEAEFEFNSGAGSFVIKDKTDQLFDGATYSNIAGYDFIYDKTDSIAFLELTYEKSKKNYFESKLRNRVELSFNENPIWDFDLNFGAAKGRFDLSELKVRNVNLNAGAVNVYLKLGDKHDSTKVDVEMGAASLKIEIPEDSGCKVYGDMVLMSKSLKGFDKKDSGYYETENYATAKNKIDLRINGGVSSLKVVRY